MRASFSGIMSRLDRLSQRVRVVAADQEAEFAKRIKTMTDVELEFHLVETTEAIVGPLVGFETLDALIQKYGAVSGEPDLTSLKRALREPYERRRWFIEHATHGEPELVWPTKLEGPCTPTESLPLGPRLLVACSCGGNQPAWVGAGRVYTYLELVPDTFRRRLLERHAQFLDQRTGASGASGRPA
jgi:hypothetical protein